MLVGMDETKSTRIKIDVDTPTGISSRAHGSNINAVAFNIDLISAKNPALAANLLKEYDEAHKILPDDPPDPGEDFSLALDKLWPFQGLAAAWHFRCFISFHGDFLFLGPWPGWFRTLIGYNGRFLGLPA